MSKALKAAIEADDVAGARKAIATVKDLNRKLPGAATPVLYACRRGAGQVLGLLIEAGAAVKGEDSYAGNHPFVVAEENGHAGVMEVLWERGLVPAQVLRHAVQDAATHGREEVLVFMLERCRPPIDAMLIRMAAISKKPSILRALAKAGGDFNGREDHAQGSGMTPLHSVVDGSGPQIVRAMVECGADVNTLDALGRTPLMVLAAGLADSFSGDGVPTLAALLELGADGSLKDRDGNDALDHYRFSGWRERAEEDQRITELLKKAGAHGDEPTLRLFQAEDAATARQAIAAGADVNRVPPVLDLTPLSWAAGGPPEILELLLEACADVNKPDRRGTPLIHAAAAGNLPAVRRLVEAGADVEAMEPAVGSTRSRRNAYLAAEERGRHEVMDYLRSIGSGRPRPRDWKPLEPGVHSWNDFCEVLAKGDVGTVANALAAMLDGRAEMNACGRSFQPGDRAYVVVRPRGMAWCNVLRVAPPPMLFEDVAAHCTELARRSGAPVLSVQYSDTSDAASIDRFEPDGRSSRDDGWDPGTLREVVDGMGSKTPRELREKLKAAEAAGDETTSSERLERLAVEERFVLAAFWLQHSPGRPLELSFIDYPAEAFDGVAFVST